MPRTVIEPFKIRLVEPIRLTSREERERFLAEAKLNVFRLRAEDVLLDLVRLAFPRRVYTQSHFDYAAEVVLELKARSREVRGVRIARQAPVLRHFTAEMRWA